MKRIEYECRHPIVGWSVLVLTSIVICSYCLHRPRQSDLEQRFMGQLIRAWEMYEARHPEMNVTNALQLFEDWSGNYPYAWHEQFRVFGEHAGFQHSIGEKYVFLQPGLEKQPYGEIVMLNAVPYSDNGSRSRLQRMVVLKHFQIRSWSEDFVQKVFREAGREIPRPPTLPAPPPPPGGGTGVSKPFWLGVQTAFTS